MGSDVQDTLITVLSEKTLPIPELNTAVDAQRGFNVIATANTRDKGVNEFSSALKRRFNVVVLPLPTTIEEETRSSSSGCGEIGTRLKLPPIAPADKEIARIVTLFRELRDGQDAQRQDQAQDAYRAHSRPQKPSPSASAPGRRLPISAAAASTRRASPAIW